MTKRNFKLFLKNKSQLPSAFTLRSRSTLYSIALSFLFVFSTASKAFDENTQIGKTTLIIGKAFITRNGNKTPLKRGSIIYVGDKVTTLNNGHVHIKFKDQGIISVRPNSKLDIQNYQFDSNFPAASAVKFELVRGVVRSVSGKAAKAARDKFRMNTPIAAIGVRGTDFVISASQKRIQAFVNEGAIVVSPFSDLCSAAAAGPCMSNSVELRGDSGQLLELNNQQSLATIRAASGEVLPALLYQSQNKILRKKKKITSTEKKEVSNSNSTIVETTQVLDSSGKTDSNKTTDENSNSLLLTSESKDLIIKGDNQENLVIDKDSGPLSFDSVELVPAVAVDPVSPTAIVVDTTLTTDFTNPSPLQFVTPTTSISSDDLNERQLAWGRWSNIADINDKISVSYEIATSGRRITVGTEALGLFRKNNETFQLANNLGNVSFDLELADVDFVTSDYTEQMNVNAASLSMNFNTNSFATNLSLQSNTTGTVGFSSQGEITDNGLFNSNNIDQKLSGAVSFDGNEAAYYFEKKLGSGLLQGSTLWGRK